VDSFYQSARLNAVSAFPLSGQCPPLNDWPDFCRHFEFLQACGIAQGIKDLYWDVRPKPEFGTVEIRVCDTPLSIEQAIALAAFAQSLARWLLRTRPPLHTDRQAHVARYNKFQACRFGFAAELADPLQRCTTPLATALPALLDQLCGDADDLGCRRQLDRLRALCDQYQFFQISGEDINQPRQKFICEAMRNPEFDNLVDAAWALIGHELSATECLARGMFSAETLAKMPSLDARIDYFKNYALQNAVKS